MMKGTTVRTATSLFIVSLVRVNRLKVMVSKCIYRNKEDVSDLKNVEMDENLYRDQSWLVFAVMDYIFVSVRVSMTDEV